MKISEHLTKETKKELGKMHTPKTKHKNKTKRKPKPQKEEKINWHELMGSNNRGLVRGKGGALKRR